MFLTFSDVLAEYPFPVTCHCDSSSIPEGTIEVGIIKTDFGWDVWNIHPLRKGWQKVYTLKHCNPEEQCLQSLQSLKRLFEKD